MGIGDWLYRESGAKYLKDAGDWLGDNVSIGSIVPRSAPRSKSRLGVTVGGPRSQPRPTIPGMVSQAPGGWDPNSRFADPNVQGDAVAPATDVASLIAEIMAKSGGSSGGAAARAKAAAEAAEARRRQAGLDRYAGTLIDRIQGGEYKQPYDTMRGALSQYLTQGQTGINAAYDTAQGAVDAYNAVNPYQNVTAETTQVDPMLDELLASQGVSNDPLTRQVAASREAAGQRGDAFGDMMKVLAANYRAGGTQRGADLASNRAASLADVLGVSQAYGNQIGAQEAAALTDLEDLLSKASIEGADVGRIYAKRKAGKGAGDAPVKAKPKPKPKPKAKGKK